MNLFIEREDRANTYLTSKILDEKTVDIFCESVCVNSDANPRYNDKSEFEHLGNKTECALIELCIKLGYDYKKYRPSEKLVRIIPFSSRTKRMTTVYQTSQGKYSI